MGFEADSRLLLEENERETLWQRLSEITEEYISRVDQARVTPLEIRPDEIRSFIESFDLEHPLGPVEAVNRMAEGLWRFSVHTPHPRYFGLFNPAVTSMGIAGDHLTAAFNPQLAAWSHSPLAAEIEIAICRAMGERFGYDPKSTDGNFTSGGAEANHTALLTALVDRFPEYLNHGVRALDRAPVMYISEEGHHSFLKAAPLCGLGINAVREAPSDPSLRMDLNALNRQIREDRASGLAPFLVVATAGTTNAGVLDPIPEIAQIAEREGLWFHVDAAWGGAASLVPELRPLLAGAERADSITFDAHKWLSVPMGSGMYLTRHPNILTQTFSVETGYMPRDSKLYGGVDGYRHSMQWSRRFIGLKVFLSLAVAGWEGYAEAIRHQTAMGNLLRRRLTESDWILVNATPLPVICFVDGESEAGSRVEQLEALARHVVNSGRAWLSVARLAGGRRAALRACITGYRTGPEDVEELVAALANARSALREQ